MYITMHGLKHLKFVEKVVPADFFAWMDFFYRIKGLQPPRNPVSKTIYFLVAVPHLFMCTFLLISLEWLEFVLTFGKKCFIDTMFNMSVAMLDTIAVFRFVIWFFTRTEISAIKQVIRRDSFQFECFRITGLDFQPVIKVAGRDMARTQKPLSYRECGQWWSNAEIFISTRRAELEVFRRRAMFYTRLVCCILHLAITATSIFSYSLSFINEANLATYEAFNERINRTSTFRHHQYALYFPFDASFDGYYWLRFFYEVYGHIGNLLTFLPIETMITNMIIHLISQTLVVEEAFRHVDKDISPDQSKTVILLIKEMRIVKCINELQQIYKAVDMLENLCNVQLLIQYGSAVLLLCSICYVIPLINSRTQCICWVIFLTASLGEIFIFSYCCQTLSLQLQKVALSVYFLDWPNYPPKLKRSLIFLLSRIRKPANLTAGKILVLDLLFFIKVVQKSYSFYTLISKTR